MVVDSRYARQITVVEVINLNWQFMYETEDLSYNKATLAQSFCGREATRLSRW